MLAGYREAMDGLMRADPGLVRRFPTSLHLEDYTADELAAIAKQTAASRFGLRFGHGVAAALAAHIASVHGHEVHAHNASLAVALVEAAINRLALRVVGWPRPLEAASMPASPAQGLAAEGSASAAAASASSASAPPPALSVDPTVLVASDFGIVGGPPDAPPDAPPKPPSVSA